MNRTNDDPSGLSRREALRIGAGTILGAAMLAGEGEVARLRAQGEVQATPPPATDPHYPMAPSWNRELRKLAPNVYAYTQALGPGMPSAGVSTRE